jgi:hypothetical protein
LIVFLGFDKIVTSIIPFILRLHKGFLKLTIKASTSGILEMNYILWGLLPKTYAEVCMSNIFWSLLFLTWHIRLKVIISKLLQDPIELILTGKGPKLID